MTEVHVVVPEGIDDPARPSGGNTYDRRVCRGLAALGWAVHEHAVPGAWPRPARPGTPRSPAPSGGSPTAPSCCSTGWSPRRPREVLVPEARRLRLVVLVHMPLGDRQPARGAAVRVLRRPPRSSRPARGPGAGWWSSTRCRRDRVHVAEPGVDPAELAPGTAAGGALLCVAAVIARQGPRRAARRARDGDGPVLALRVRRQPGPRPGVRRAACAAARATAGWTAACASRDRAPAPELDRAYAAADLLVLAVARRDVRHGRHRGPGPRPAGRRRRGRRGAGGPRARRGRHAAGAAGPARRPGRARRRAAAPGSATPSCAGACAGRPASGARRCAGWPATTSVLAGVLAGAAR